MARVYCKWTGDHKAPWCEKTFSPKDGVSWKKNAKAKKRRATLAALNNDVCGALIKSGYTRREAIIPFCGDTHLLFAHKRSRKRGRAELTSPAPLRIMVVFWAPGAIAAKRRSIHVENTSENAILHLLHHAFKVDKTKTKTNPPPILVDITYLIPRWKRADGGAGHFASTIPQDLAYGIWRLGVHASLTAPDVILSTNVDVARTIEHSNGLNPTAFMTEEVKAAAAQLPVLGMDPEAFSGVPTIPTIKRVIRGESHRLPSTESRRAPTGICHCRIPHPYLMSSDAVHKDIRQQHHILLLRIAEYLRSHVTPGLQNHITTIERRRKRERPLPSGDSIQAAPQKKAKLLLSSTTTTGDEATSVSESPPKLEGENTKQPILVLRQQEC